MKKIFFGTVYILLVAEAIANINSIVVEKIPITNPIHLRAWSKWKDLILTDTLWIPLTIYQAGGNSAPSPLLNLRTGGTASNDGPAIQFFSADNHGTDVLAGKIATLLTSGSPGGFASDMAIYTTTGSSNTEQMRVTSSGKVGIGTSSPVFTLEVNGSIASTNYYPSFTMKPGYWSGNEFYIQSGVNTAANDNGEYTTFINPSSKGFNFRQGSTDIFTINPSGLVTVNAVFKARKVVVTQTGWSDYVFNENYKLRPLSEVAQYIGKYKHLPEMPSETEVLKNGNDIGETQVLLLKKIEELTLYIIEQQKQIDELKTKSGRKRQN